jgi:hypothetical protein
MTVLKVSICAMILAVFTIQSAAKAEDRDDSSDPRIQRGFEIAPVPLNLQGKRHDLVGLGSYLVNAEMDCNVCHNALPGPNGQYAKGGSAYFGQPTVINQSTYLGGGRDFGLLVPGDTTHIISRNLTPDVTGRPAGGRTFEDFLHIFRTGEDLDHLHPTCSTTVTANCLHAPFDGNLLQIMPWPRFQLMTKHDIRAIYEYLRTVPCIEGPPAPSVLHNQCT